MACSSAYARHFSVALSTHCASICSVCMDSISDTIDQSRAFCPACIFRAKAMIGPLTLLLLPLSPIIPFPHTTGCRVLQVPIFSDNYSHVVVDERTGTVAAVDPADPGPVLKAMESAGIDRLDALLITHKVSQHRLCGFQCRKLAGLLAERKDVEAGCAGAKTSRGHEPCLRAQRQQCASPPHTHAASLTRYYEDLLL